MTIKDDGHLLQGVTPGFWVEEVDCDAQKNEHDDEDEVVLPAYALQSNRVDESVEEDCDDGSRQSDNQATRPQAIRPNFARIRSLEWCPKFLVSLYIETNMSS